MKMSVKSAVWAGIITMISGAVLMSSAPRQMAFLAWPSLPGFFLTFLLGVGPGIEGIPAPTNIAVHVLTFAVWWGIFYIVLTRWRRHRHRYGAPLP
jgi:hypothetical protein